MVALLFLILISLLSIAYFKILPKLKEIENSKNKKPNESKKDEIQKDEENAKEGGDHTNRGLFAIT